MGALVSRSFWKSVQLLRWLVFLFCFRQTTERNLHVPLCGTEVNRLWETQRWGSSPCFSQNIFVLFKRNIQNRTRLKSPFHFFRVMRLFSKMFLMFPYCPLQFSILCNKLDVNKALILHFSATFFHIVLQSKCPFVAGAKRFVTIEGHWGKIGFRVVSLNVSLRKFLVLRKKNNSVLSIFKKLVTLKIERVPKIRLV